MTEDPTTEELRLDQLRREDAERERAERAVEPDDTDQHEARAAKAGYLRAKLEERAEAERRAAGLLDEEAATPGGLGESDAEDE